MEHVNAARNRQPIVVLVTPGGIAGGGGMGSVSRTIAEWFETHQPNACHVIDSRGEGSAYKSLYYTSAGLVRLGLLRLRGASVLHLQVSERLSFLRKGLFGLAGKLLGMRVIVHHHGAEFFPAFERGTRAYKAVVRGLIGLADVNIVLGRAWYDFIERETSASGDKLTLLYNSISDISPEIETRRRQLPRHKERRQFLFLANLTPRKGVSEFLQALLAMHQEQPNVSAVIAGGGEVERYKREAESLGIAEICRFTGWIDRPAVLQLLAESDAMVLPSYNEGLPISLLEALCAGVPVIATPVGAIPEVFHDGKNCLLVEPGNVEALTRAMRLLASDTSLAATLRRNGRLSYEQNFMVDRYMQSMCEIYRLMTSASATVSAS